jgi:hypothetical protein
MAVNRFRAVMSGIRLRVERSARNPLILVAAMAAALALAGCVAAPVAPLPAASSQPAAPAPTTTSEPAAPVPTNTSEPAAAQPAATLTVEEKIQSAMSAAPMAIAKDATIMDFPPSGQTEPVLLRNGTNNWTCYPDWPATSGNDPECNDPMFEAWFRALLAGEQTPKVTAPGISYMLEGGVDASETDPFAAQPAPGEDWIVSPAHVMLILPDGFDAKQFPPDPQSGKPYIMWDGTPYEHLMVPVALTEFQEADVKIRSAMSAAPLAVSKDATILDWPAEVGGEMTELRKGTNGWTCLPDWQATPGNDPECLDETAMAWLNALMAGTEPAITRPGLAYLLQGCSAASATDPSAAEPPPGKGWVVDPPTLIFLVPGGFDLADFPTPPEQGQLGQPWIMFEGTHYEHLMVPVADRSQSAGLSQVRHELREDRRRDGRAK